MLPLLVAAVGGSIASASPDLHLGYHGHMLTHPGVAGRVSWPQSDRRFSVVPELEGGGWVHPRNQLALYVRGGGALRHRGGKGGQHDLFLHLGGQRSTFLVPTYNADNQDDLRRPALAGQWWGTATAGLGLGRKSWFVRPQLTFRAPYFHGFGTDFAVQVGTRLGGAR